VLPKYKDCFGLPVRQEVSLGDASDFIKYDSAESTLYLSIDPADLVKYVG